MRRWLVADLTPAQMKSLRAAVWARMDSDGFVSPNQRALLRRAWLAVSEAWERAEEAGKNPGRPTARPHPPVRGQIGEEDRR
jgi:hypothetical protein